jgi:hypothetical protein
MKQVEHLGTREGNIWKVKLETNNKNKNIRNLYRGINEFRKGYQDENVDLLADPESVLNRWKNFFNQELNVRGVHDCRQMGIAIGKLKRYNSLGTDQMPAKLIKAGVETLCSEIHKLICSIKRVIRVIVIIIKEYPSYQLLTKLYPTFFWPDSLYMPVKLLVIIIVGSVIIDYYLSDFYIWQIPEKKWEYNGTVH